MRAEIKDFPEGFGVGVTFLFIALWKSIQLSKLLGFPLAFFVGFLVTDSLKLKA
tara:strand:+ start:49 stop:210 length:162 start_codon:yes stop_codon:yes gene_type:complete